MKIKMYLKGLGIGIIVAVLFLSIENNRIQDKNDDYVISRAKELGMVYQTDKSLSDIKEYDYNQESVPSDTESANMNQPTQIPDESEQPKDSPVDLLEEEVNSEEANAPETEDISTDEKEFEGIYYTVTVKAGSGSETVAKSVKEAGLVEDASEFDKYLCDKGYARYIRVGMFEIPANSSYEEIAKILTGK